MIFRRCCAQRKSFRSFCLLNEQMAPMLLQEKSSKCSKTTWELSSQSNPRSAMRAMNVFWADNLASTEIPTLKRSYIPPITSCGT
jgi:hypothetical protein